MSEVPLYGMLAPGTAREREREIDSGAQKVFSREEVGGLTWCEIRFNLKHRVVLSSGWNFLSWHQHSLTIG